MMKLMTKYYLKRNIRADGNHCRKNDIWHKMCRQNDIKCAVKMTKCAVKMTYDIKCVIFWLKNYIKDNGYYLNVRVIIKWRKYMHPVNTHARTQIKTSKTKCGLGEMFELIFTLAKMQKLVSTNFHYFLII